ncbi:MAG: DUF58 domain-containing protein [Peptococcaceae bacterium]
MLDKDLLDAKILTRLAGYRLVRQKPAPGQEKGAWYSRQKGGAIEFIDYRNYTLGDEMRQVDWKTYARLGRLYVKEHLDEKQDTTLLLVDTSASMDWGEAAHKGRYALQIAMGLGSCVLFGGDRLIVTLTGENKKSGQETSEKKEQKTRTSLKDNDNIALEKTTSEFKSQKDLPRLWQFLRATNLGSSARLTEKLRWALNVTPKVKNLYVFSDLYDLFDVQEMLRLAAGQKLETTICHILSPEERLPSGEGEFLLVDSENGAQTEVALNPAAYLTYLKRLEEFYQEIDRLCYRWGVKSVLLDSSENVQTTFFKTLPQAGILKPIGVL